MARWRNKGAPIAHDGGWIEQGAVFEAEADAQVVRQRLGKLERLKDPEPEVPGDDIDTPEEG